MAALYTLGSQERIKSTKLIDTLFSGGNSQSIVAYPLRVVYMKGGREADTPQAQIMVSVSKRHFKRAVKRNRVKRQIREAYRLNKNLLSEKLTQQPDMTLYLAWIWQADELFPSSVVEERMKILLHCLAEKL